MENQENQQNGDQIGTGENKATQSVTKNEDSMLGNKDAENKGSQPAPHIADGGGSEQKQPKEHTGKDTEMGGATGGTSGLPDASEGSDNTGSAG